eukprot:5346050-Amphidinium_carterae.1
MRVLLLSNSFLVDHCEVAAQTMLKEVLWPQCLPLFGSPTSECPPLQAVKHIPPPTSQHASVSPRQRRNPPEFLLGQVTQCKR